MKNFIAEEKKSYVYKLLKYYGEALLVAQEKFDNLKKQNPDAVKTLLPKYLAETCYDKLTPLQREFHQLYEHRKLLCDKLKLLNYPIIDSGACFPIRNHDAFLKANDLMKSIAPDTSVLSVKGGFIVILTTKEELAQAKHLISAEIGLNPKDIVDMDQKTIPTLIAGMATPSQVKSLLKEIDSYENLNARFVAHKLNDQCPNLQ